MTLLVTFEVSERDLKYFRRALRNARKAVQHADDDEIIHLARETLNLLVESNAPDFVASQMGDLASLIDMVGDDEWRLPSSLRARVLAVLVYFCDPEDLIPDSMPAIGLLDDAIMINLVCRDLRHEIEAYADFSHFRKTYFKRYKIGRDKTSYSIRLGKKRTALFERVKRRRSADAEQTRKPRQPAQLW